MLGTHLHLHCEHFCSLAIASNSLGKLTRSIMFDYVTGRRLWIERPVRGFCSGLASMPAWVLTGAGRAGGLCTCRTWLNFTMVTHACVLHMDHAVRNV